jgi:hypothetical protein
MKKSFETNAKFPFELKYVIEWPDTYMFENTKYYKVIKSGTRMTDGCPTQCYESLDNKQIWLSLDGEVQTD